ncbi:hypothetical protein B0O99DRAFT_666802 [Bisporella sp. PMI_857]|nr:hypothetical protein B0O99DRAFT_666802 [Bisporella sp. PMI_857]
MSSQNSDPPRKQSLGSRLANALRPKKSSNKLRKSSDQRPEELLPNIYRQNPLPPLPTQRNEAQLAQSAPVNFYNKGPGANNAQTGELWDEAEMLHSLLRRDSHDSLDSLNKIKRMRSEIPDSKRKPGEAIVASLPPPIWEHITSHMTPTDTANLALSSKTLLSRLGNKAFLALNYIKNDAQALQYKIDFLLPMDKYLPDHLFCFPCIIYHRRIQKGSERLRPKDVLNPIYTCPNTKFQSRHRLTQTYDLPFTFVQLAFRAYKYGPSYGIPLESLSKRYKSRDSEWSHQTRYYFHKSHLLLRVTSKVFAIGGLPPAGLRNFLYSREDYTPFFSVCAHWRDGELMNLCKCALSHMPAPQSSIAQQLRAGPKISTQRLKSDRDFVSLCSDCKPMRRCPDCPTEYLIEIKLEEDRTDPDPIKRFKQCMVVTRWSDLGDGTDPTKGEWAACNGEARYDSFKHIGRRALAGIFESQNGVSIPGQTILSLNPKGERKGEEGHNWY